MDVILESLQYPWAIRALLASILVGITCGILGCFIVLRNMALIGDALSHSILPGIVVAFLITGYSSAGLFLGAVMAGLITAFAIIWIQQKFSTKADAAVGIVFTSMFALGVIGISLISSQRGVHLDLKDFLFGNVLGVSNADLQITGMVALFTVASVLVFYRYLFITSFQPVVADTMGISSAAVKYYLMFLLALAVVSALQMVGVILVVSMLITPAATALLLSNNLKKVLVLSALIGVSASVLGFMAAIVLEITPGPAMAVTVAVFYLIAGTFSPSKGAFQKYLGKRKYKFKIREEDIIKNIYKYTSLGKQLKIQNFTVPGIEPSILEREIKKMSKKEWLSLEDAGVIKLTAEGEEKASQLVRAHRLWESYLAGRIGLNEEQIHEDAEILEHVLPEELLDEVEKNLGYPEVDPHGSPIPMKKNIPVFSVTHLQQGETATISHHQISEHISAELWSRGIKPEARVSILKITEGNYVISADDFEVVLPVRLARMINVEKTS
jgi:ABC-type Mn2+/Zn2+ transport system permease subunit/Mn-dependent DtxR family transcriptional regulator